MPRSRQPPVPAPAGAGRRARRLRPSGRRRDRPALVRNTRTGRRGGAAVDRHELPAHPDLRDRLHARGHPVAQPRRPHEPRGARLVRHGPTAVQGRDQPAEDGQAEVGLHALDDPAPRRRSANPAAAQRQLRAWRDDVKVPIFIQGAIHGNEYEGVDANMRTIERLATTPYGTDPEVDAILDGAVVVFNVIQNPDGRVAGTRANGNGFDLNRDFLTQSQSETKASVRIMQEWLPPETLDLHGYVTPTLIEATTKPHNPGIDYDLWLKWNQSRIDANEAAMNAVNMSVTRPVNDWCSDGSVSVQGAICPDGQPAGPAVAESWDDWGPFYTPMYSQLVGLNGSTVEMCSSTNTGTNPLNRCYLNADPDPAKNPIGRNASLLAQLTVSWSTLLFDTANRNDLLNDQLEIYRRGVAGEARPRVLPGAVRPREQLDARVPERVRDPARGGPAQRRRGEPPRRLAALQRHRGAAAPLRRRDPRPGRREGLVRRRHGAGPPGSRRDVARDRRRRLQPDRHPLRAARRRGATATSGAPTRCRCRTACRSRRRRRSRSRSPSSSAAASRAARPTTTRSRSTRRPRCGR